MVKHKTKYTRCCRIENSSIKIIGTTELTSQMKDQHLKCQVFAPANIITTIARQGSYFAEISY